MNTSSLKSHSYRILNWGTVVIITLLFSTLVSAAQSVSADYQKANSGISDIAQYNITNVSFNEQTQCENWDSSAVQKPSVLWDQDEGVYKMWFDGRNQQDITQIGLATSGDGITWAKYDNNPVLSGSPGAWDEFSEEHAPFVLKEDGTYKMWYEGGRGGTPRQLGYAISTNGIDWFKYAGNPVLQAGPEAYDQDGAGHGSVLKDGDMYKLWYHTNGDQGVVIAYATSSDGISWTKQGPVLLPAPGSWDIALWGPSVLKLDGVYWMWYSASRTQGTTAIGVVTSTNGINWNRFLNTPVLSETTNIGDPHVISDNGKLKMWYNNFSDGVINYAESDDGVTWSKSPSNPGLTPGNAYCQVFLPLSMLNP
jgi:predicted GH43/DUF377 family glycosyl hydrolase